MAARRSKIFRSFLRPIWITNAGAGTHTGGLRLNGVNWFRQHSDGELNADEHKIVPCSGYIDLEPVEVNDPESALLAWEWRKSPGPWTPMAPEGNHQPIDLNSDRPITLRFELNEARLGDQMGTTVRATHADVPIEWADDLAAYWKWQLERIRHSLLKSKR